MKETQATFDKGFTVGLEPDPSINTLSEWLSECYNMLPTEKGLEPRKDVYEPDLVIQKDWPFPAWYMLTRFNVCVTRKAFSVYSQDMQLISTTPHTFTSLPHIADFMDYFVICEEDGEWGMLLGKDTYSLGNVRFKTCCNLFGQLLIGNCKMEEGPELCDCAGHPDFIVPVEGCNIVGWARIGAVDWEWTLSNEVGWAPMPWQGCVRAILPLGHDVMVYGDNGVAKMKPADSPTQTFGVHLFGPVGVLSRECVAGDSHHHLYLGTNFNLYLVEQERALSADGKTTKKIGYEKYMRQLEGEIVISFDSANRHWWIGDDKKCFIYNGVGLAEASLTPSHLNHVDGVPQGFAFPHGPDKAFVQTSPISFGSRGIKTLMCVESDIETHPQHLVYGQGSWKSNYERQFRHTPPILLDPRGGFFPVLAGTELRVRYIAPDFRHFLLTKLWLHYKNTDKHFSRGVINAGRPPE